MLFSNKRKREAQEKEINKIKELLQSLSDRLDKLEEKQDKCQESVDKALKASARSVKDIISMDTVLRTAIYSQNQLMNDVNELFELVKSLDGVETIQLYGFSGNDEGGGYVN